MDPDVTLADIRRLAAAVLAAGNPWDTAEAGQELAEKLQGLDGWLGQGGFLPGPWNHSYMPAADLGETLGLPSGADDNAVHHEIEALVDFRRAAGVRVPLSIAPKITED